MQHPKDDEQPDRADDTAKAEGAAKADDAETVKIEKGKADVGKAGGGKADTGKPAETKKPSPDPPKPPIATPEPTKSEPASEAKTQAIPVQKKGADSDAETTAIPKQKPPASEAKTEAIPVPKKPQPPAPRPASGGQRPPTPPPAPPNRPPQQTRPPQQQQRAQPQRVLPPQQSRPQQSPPQRSAPASGAPAAPAAVKADANGDTKRGRSWRFAAIGAAVVVVLAIVIAGVVLYQQHAAENSPEAKVQRSIDTFVTALREGDLATLRTSTCGSLAEYYNSISPEEFANVHNVAMDQQSLPVVGAVDAIQFTGNQAIAQVSAHTTANPGEQSLRTFNLEKIDETWKICNPPR